MPPRKRTEPDVVARWVGPEDRGYVVSGVPARDLVAADFVQMPMPVTLTELLRDFPQLYAPGSATAPPTEPTTEPLPEPEPAPAPAEAASAAPQE